MDNLTNITVVRELMKRHGCGFSKRYGQNFLVNPSVCPRIAQEGNAAPGFGIIEIGAGIGTLTHELALRADKVVSFEIDGTLLPVLDETLAEHKNVRVLHEDIMKADLPAIIDRELSGLRIAVCANLPYYITSPVVMLLLESRLPFESVTVMVQREAARRLCAEPGTREAGAVSAAVRYYGRPRVLFDVSRGSFMPAPNVDSSVIRIDVSAQREYCPLSEEMFFRTVRGAFSQRRKTLLNSLSSAMNMSKNDVSAALEDCAVDPQLRAEALTMEQLVAVSDALARR